MKIPKRIQLSRQKGWCMPISTVKVDRSTMWGNHAAKRKGILTGVFKNKEDANYRSNKHRIACISIDVEEGEGLT